MIVTELGKAVASWPLPADWQIPLLTSGSVAPPDSMMPVDWTLTCPGNCAAIVYGGVVPVPTVVNVLVAGSKLTRSFQSIDVAGVVVRAYVPSWVLLPSISNAVANEGATDGGRQKFLGGVQAPP